MASKIASDPRIDPRIKALFGAMDLPGGGNVRDRAELLEQTKAAEAAFKGMQTLFEMFDNEEIAPSKGLSVTVEKITSQPDGNTINLRIIRPDNNERVPCVYYIHGGGMAFMSCFDANYRAWGKIIAAQG